MRTLLVVYIALLALLFSTVGLSFTTLGAFSLPLSLAIGAAKAALIAWFFMQLQRAEPVLKLAAAVGFIWLGILLALSFADFAFR